MLFDKNWEWTNTFLVADRISGVFSDARESQVRTLAEQILLDLPCKVDVVGEVDEAHGEGPDVPLEDVLVCVVCFIFKKATNPSLS